MSLKDKIIEAKDKTKDWLVDHQGDIIYGCYVAACIGSVVVPVVLKVKKYQRNSYKTTQIYDPSMGFYWETKKPLTNNQKLIIEQRHRLYGESYGEILRDLHLLKR